LGEGEAQPDHRVMDTARIASAKPRQRRSAKARAPREGRDKKVQPPILRLSITKAPRWQRSQTSQEEQGVRDFRASMRPGIPTSPHTRPRKPPLPEPVRCRTMDLR